MACLSVQAVAFLLAMAAIVLAITTWRPLESLCPSSSDISEKMGLSVGTPGRKGRQHRYAKAVFRASDTE